MIILLHLLPEGQNDSQRPTAAKVFKSHTHLTPDNRHKASKVSANGIKWCFIHKSLWLGSQRQEDDKFKISLGWIAKPYLSRPRAGGPSGGASGVRVAGF